MKDKEKLIIYWQDMLEVYKANVNTINESILRNYDCPMGEYPKYTIASDDYIDSKIRVKEVEAIIKELKE